MKKLLSFLALCLPVLGAAMLSTSCDKEIETMLTTSTQSLQFTAEGGSQTFKVQSNNSWAIIPSSNFATVSPMTGNGDATVVVILPEYEKMESRSCTLSILSDDGTKSVTVAIEQKGATATLDVDMKELIFEATAKCERTIKVTSNTSWSVSNLPSWLNASTSSGNKDASITFTTASDNNSSKAREAEVTISEQSGKSCTVKVSQAGKYAPNCQLYVSDVVSLTESVAFLLTWDLDVSYFYIGMWYEDLTSVSDEEIVAVIKEEWTPTTIESKYTGYIYDYEDYPGTTGNLCIVGFNKDHQHGDLTIVKMSTLENTGNYPQAYITGLGYSYEDSAWLWSTQTSGLCDHYYTHVILGASIEDVYDYVLYTDAGVLWKLLYEEKILEKTPWLNSTTIASDNGTLNNERYIHITTVGADRNDKLSGVINRAFDYISNTRAPIEIPKREIKELKGFPIKR